MIADIQRAVMAFMSHPVSANTIDRQLHDAGRRGRRPLQQLPFKPCHHDCHGVTIWNLLYLGKYCPYQNLSSFIVPCNLYLPAKCYCNPTLPSGFNYSFEDIFVEFI